jgi:hypothetical protein
LAFHLIKAPFTLTCKWWFKFFPSKTKNQWIWACNNALK